MTYGTVILNGGDLYLRPEGKTTLLLQCVLFIRL